MLKIMRICKIQGFQQKCYFINVKTRDTSIYIYMITTECLKVEIIIMCRKKDAKTRDTSIYIYDHYRMFKSRNYNNASQKRRENKGYQYIYI